MDEVATQTIHLLLAMLKAREDGCSRERRANEYDIGTC
jgi:hypothetical protein